MQFELNNFTKVRMVNMNNRIEKHGVQSVPAVDLNFTMDSANTILNMFRDGLLEDTYKAAEYADDGQDDLDGVEKISHLPKLKDTSMMPLRWDWKGAGYKLSIDFGLGGDSNIDLGYCKVGKIVADLKEGGTVELKFQVQIESGLTEQIIGKLAMLNGSEFDIVLIAPKVIDSDSAAVFDEPLFPDYVPDAPLTAEDVFIGTATADELAAVH